MDGRRFTRKTTPPDWLLLDEWPEVNTDTLEEPKRLRVSTLIEAIRRYVRGDNLSSYLSENGLSREALLRAFNRCVARDAKGVQFGWRGLLPGLRIHSPVRRKPLNTQARSGSGLTGALALLWQRHPDLQQEFDKYLLANAKRKPGAEAGLRHKSAHQKFIQLCQQRGLPDSEWPLCMEKKGSGAIRSYVNQFIEARYDDVVATQFGDKARAKSKTGTGHESRLHATRPFDIVELDEHRCQFIGSIGIETPEGVRWLPVQRITIILAADRKTSVVLAYKAIFRREANTDDILDVIDAACGRRQAHIYAAQVPFTTSPGFPSDLSGSFATCGFNQLLLDNALVHLAAPVISRVRDIVGCDVNFGPVAHFERRPIVEYVFNALERAGFRRLQSTTGTGPMDPSRQEPEKAAAAGSLTLQAALDLIEAIIVDHNTKQGKRNFGHSPMRQLEALYQDDAMGLLLPEIPPLAAGVAPLSVSLESVLIRGNKSKGRRPYVYFEEEDYAGEELKDRWDLIGQRVIVHALRTNIQSVDIHDAKGTKIATITVRGRWRHSPHSRDFRRHVNKLIRDGYLQVPYDQDAVHWHLKQIATGLAKNQRPGKSNRASINAQAEEQRVRSADASAVSEDALRGILERTRRQAPAEQEQTDDEMWEMNDLPALNGPAR